MRRLGDRLGEQAALVEAHIARGRADQPADGVPLHVLGHVEAHQLHAQGPGQLAADLGLAHPGGAGEHEGTDRFVVGLETGAGQFDRRRYGVDGVFLAEHGHLQIPLQVLQHFLVGRGHLLGRNPGDLRHDGFHVRLIDGFPALAFRAQPLPGTDFVDHVDGLVRQEAIVDVARAQLRRRLQRRVGVDHVVVRLETALEPLEDAHGVLHRGFHHVDLLETAGQRPILLEDGAVLGESGGPHALELAGGQHRLEQVGGVHNAAGRRPGTDDGVNLIDEQNGVVLLAQFREQVLQALLEITPVLGARQQRAQIQGVDGGVEQRLGHPLFHDHPRQPLGDGGLADTRLAHQQGVVLAAAAEDLRGALDLERAAHQRVDTVRAGQLVEIAGVGFQRAGRCALCAAVHFLALFRRRVVVLHLGNTVGDEIDHVQTVHVLAVEQVNRLALLFVEDRHQHVGAGDFLIARGLHAEYGTLQHPLETQGRLRVAFTVFRQQRGGIVDELSQGLAQLFHIGAAGAQHFHRRLVIEQRQQQVFHGHEFMPVAACVVESLVESQFQFFAEHRLPHCLLPAPLPETIRPFRPDTSADADFHGRNRPLARPWFRRCPGETPRTPPSPGYAPSA